MDGQVHIESFIIEGDYIKAFDVTQDLTGKTFCLPYFDSGHYKILMIDKDSLNYENIIDLNEKCKIDCNSVPSLNFPYTLMNLLFCSENHLFVNLFHTPTTSNYHFIYCMKEKIIISKIVGTQLNCSPANFPCKSFYNKSMNQVFIFYRHG
jgi:hypothetical protein